MARDLEFRNRLKEMLEGDAEDDEIVRYVLYHALNQWPTSTMRWIYEEALDRGQYFVEGES